MSAAYRGKTSKFTMGSYQRTSEEDKASIWCLQNNICITPRQAQWKVPMWYIDIEIIDARLHPVIQNNLLSSFKQTKLFCV